MKNHLKINILISYLFLPFLANAQFSQPIVIANGWFTGKDNVYPSVIYMGDQNDDGYDDFIIIQKDDSTGAKANLLFYYGNNPVNTSPSIIFPGFTAYAGYITACDVNRDGYRDIITQRRYIQNGKPPEIVIYFGGPNLDTIVDYSFTYEDEIGRSLIFKGQSWPIDINGDGWEDLIFGVTYLFGGLTCIKLMFVETESFFTSREYKTIFYDPDLLYGYFNTSFFADIDGDGKDDISYALSRKNAPSHEPLHKLRIVYGNSENDFSNFYEFTSHEYEYVASTQIIKDLHGDGKGEIVISNSPNSPYPWPYPYWFDRALSYGTKPPNLKPNSGINTQNSLYGNALVLGDVNGDGYNDFIQTMGYGTMALWLGSKYSVFELSLHKWTGSNSQNMNIGGRVGDVNGDGVDDFVIGENGYESHQHLPKANMYLILGSRSVVSTKEENQEDEKSKIEIEVHPNPANEQIQVEYKIPYAGTIKRVIVDMLGKELIKEEKRLEAGEYKEIIEIKRIGLPSGVYLYNIELNGEGKRTAKTVKFQVVK